MENQLNSGSLDNLVPGQCLLVGARKVKNGKIQLEWAEKIVSGNARAFSALQLLNASDERFSSGARRAWFPTESIDVEKHLGIDLSDSNEAWYITTNTAGNDVEIMDLNILNPYTEIEGTKYYFRMQITETTEPTEWQKENIETSAKRAGKEGDFITHNGDYIFSNSSVILLNPEDEEDEITHSFLKPDPRTVSLEEVKEDIEEEFESETEEVSMLDALDE